MTEPPDPRRPEEGGGEEPRLPEEPAGTQSPKYGPEEVGPDDFFDTDWNQLDRDDQMIDFLRTGDVTINDEAVPEEQRVADVFAAERDRVDRTPLPDSTDPEAVLAEFERRKKAAEPPAPRTPDAGGTSRMAISEEALQIRAVADDSSISATAQLAASNLGDLVFPDLSADTAGALQEGLSALETNANRAGNAAGGDDEATIHGAAAVATGALNEAMAAIQAAQQLIDQAKAAAQAAHLVADSAIAACEQFRQTCGDIAARHGA